MQRDMQCGQVKDGLSAPGKKKQIILLEAGELAKQVRSANAAYGFGKGAEEPLTREGAMMLRAFTDEVLDNFFRFAD